jgi:hypothetical protein
MRKALLGAILLGGALTGWRYQAGQISDYARAHKYCGDDPKEFTYTITSVMQFAKPIDVTDMTDDYQDARLIEQNEDWATVEITYYPLNTNCDGISENRNWKREYAQMEKYLAPTATENWDEQMRADLLTELRQASIDPDRLTDLQVVKQVSEWLYAERQSEHTHAFISYYVHYPGPEGLPEVFSSLRPQFDEQKPPGKTDHQMFEQELLGRSMFYKRVHGDCTSYAIYLATVLRALGIPTRIVVCVPPADTNDPQQKEMLLSAIHHNGVRATIRHGLPPAGKFNDHWFNEAFVGNRWVRVNYNVVGQNTLEDGQLGLETHILTTDSFSHVPMAQTWGSRLAKYQAGGLELSQLNPYRLLKVSDHFGAHAKIPDPEVKDEELRTVTVNEVYWKDALPVAVHTVMKSGDATNADFYIGIQEYIPRYANQMRDFEARAGHQFILTSPGHPDLHATLTGYDLSSEGQYQMWGVRIDDGSRKDIAAGAVYTIRPINTSEMYRWIVKGGLALRAGSEVH